jgi:hypothetical protein
VEAATRRDAETQSLCALSTLRFYSATNSFYFSATIINHRGTEFTETLRIPFHPTYGVDSFRLIEEELKAEAVLA